MGEYLDICTAWACCCIAAVIVSFPYNLDVRIIYLLVFRSGITQYVKKGLKSDYIPLFPAKNH